MDKPWYQDAFDFVTQTFDKYIDYEIFDLQKDIYEAQYQPTYGVTHDNANQPPPDVAPFFGNVSNKQLATYALLGIGALLLLKAVK